MLIIERNNTLLTKSVNNRKETTHYTNNNKETTSVNNKKETTHYTNTNNKRNNTLH